LEDKGGRGGREEREGGSQVNLHGKGGREGGREGGKLQLALNYFISFRMR